ncbi:MAG: hypothetical protein RXR03_08045, partial [Thermocladium sp.]
MRGVQCPSLGKSCRAGAARGAPPTTHNDGQGGAGKREASPLRARQLTLPITASLKNMYRNNDVDTVNLEPGSIIRI